MSKWAMICATVVFVCVLGAFVVLSLYRVDTGQFAAFLVLLIPMIGAYFKTHQIEKKVDTVVEHTNGPIAETVERIKNINDHINGEGPH